MEDIIFAPATAEGMAAIAILRVTGKGCGKVLTNMTKKPLPPERVLTLRVFFDIKNEKEIIDSCLVCWMPGPRSFTGEDSFEIYCHGGNSIINTFLEALSNQESVRFAKEGEFTKRALINGKVNLIKAEAINDLIHSETDAQRRLAIKQLNKGLTIPVTLWKNTLKYCMATIESSIDFSDEYDVPNNINIKKDLNFLKNAFSKVLKNSESYELIKKGTKIVLTGRPNAGKSSIFNSILKTKKSIVTNIPGTTRDIIEGNVNLKGYPVIFYDTAGIHKTRDTIEKEGMKRAQYLIEEADIVLNVFDARNFKIEKTKNEQWNIVNKTDLKKVQINKEKTENVIILVSCITGKGIEELLEKIYNFIKKKTHNINSSASFLSSARQKKLLNDSLNTINLALEENSEEIIAEYLREINSNLGRILGEVDIEEVLGDIFSKFCIGK